MSSQPEISRKKNSRLTICPANVSKEVAQFYLENRYNVYEECRNPCEMMIISSMFSYKSGGYNSIKFVFVNEIHVTKEKLKVSFDMLLGEQQVKCEKYSYKQEKTWKQTNTLGLSGTGPPKTRASGQQGG